eukprot:TRINITY_DN14005_c1_g1_i1.p1 TRINITY_DN14005_c1_g1~~TRINITY_DN14005_c1_g1_i1.p1  ORF type:complete len:158 (-),score=20.44 TRINITY_DN14005_c1_g1_i1:41-514(-)
MFARGQGFKATVKCQYAFRVGCVADYIAVAAACTFIMNVVETIVLFLVLSVACYRIYRKTSGLLFSSASIVKYWREELGGKPDADDPYDLHSVLECFKHRCNLDREFIMKAAGGKHEKGLTEAVDDNLARVLQASQFKATGPPAGSMAKKAGVSSLF